MKKRVPHIQVEFSTATNDIVAGIGHYTLGITLGLDELAAEGKLTYSLIVPRHRSSRVTRFNLRNYKKIITNPIPSRFMRGFMKYHWNVPMNWLLGRGRYYFPSFEAWPTWGAKSSVVFHDMTYLAEPDCVMKGHRNYMLRFMPFSTKNAHNIITVSEFSKTEITCYLHYPKSKIFVATPSIDRRLFYKRSASEIYKVKLKYDIWFEDYILSVGSIEPRKNYERLLDAYVSLPRKVTDKYPLVMVGADGWENEALLAKIQRAKENGYKIIKPARFVEDKDLPALYSGTQFFVFVPIYEGFGMPPLEALACGTPVLASKGTSVTEAVGDAAVYCDPFSAKDIAEKLRYMVSETEKDRSQWDDRINKHLESLNWRKSAEITASALTDLPVSYFKREAK